MLVVENPLVGVQKSLSCHSRRAFCTFDEFLNAFTFLCEAFTEFSQHIAIRPLLGYYKFFCLCCGLYHCIPVIVIVYILPYSVVISTQSNPIALFSKAIIIMALYFRKSIDIVLSDIFDGMHCFIGAPVKCFCF